MGQVGRWKSPVDEFTKVRIPRAPLREVSIKDGMRVNSWYDVAKQGHFTTSYNFEDIEKSRLLINKMIDHELEIFNGNSKKILIGGYKQGCYNHLLQS